MYGLSYLFGEVVSYKDNTAGLTHWPLGDLNSILGM